MKYDEFLLAIPLTTDQITLVSTWLERYLGRAKVRWGDAEIAGGMLWAHPAEFPNIIAEACPEDCTELEFYRIRKLGSNAIARSLGPRRSRISVGLREMVDHSLAGLKPTRVH